MPVPKKIEKEEERLTAKERVFRTLQQWIIDGTLEPGERINDSELANYFSVSRTPVREALQQLSEQKLVYSVPSSGTYVSSIDEDDMRHVYVMIGEIHALAVRFCQDKITEDTLTVLENLNEQFWKQANTGTSSQRAEADLRFHDYLCKLADNPYLYEYTKQLAIQVRRNENRFFKNPPALRDSYETHKRIIAALREARWTDARTLIRDNWMVSTSIFK